MQIGREMRGKCKFQMPLNSCKIDDGKKMFWGIEKYMHCKNYFRSMSITFLPMGEGGSSAMPCHFTHYLFQAFEL